MKTKYTKKQIQESIKRWQKILKESYGDSTSTSMNELVDIFKESSANFDEPIYINPTSHYNGAVVNQFIENCIKKYGNKVTIDVIKNDISDLVDDINMYFSIGQGPSIQKDQGNQVIICDMPEDGIYNLKY